MVRISEFQARRFARLVGEVLEQYNEEYPPTEAVMFNALEMIQHHHDILIGEDEA